MVKCNRCENDAIGVVKSVLNAPDEPLCPDCMLVFLQDCAVHKRVVNVSYYVSSDAVEALLAFAKERQRTAHGLDIRVSKLALPTTSPLYGKLQCRCGYVSEHHGFDDMAYHVTFKHCHGVSPDGLLNDLQDVWSGKLKAVAWTFMQLRPETTDGKWKAERIEADGGEHALLADTPSVAPIRERISPVKEGRFKRCYVSIRDFIRKKARPVPQRR